MALDIPAIAASGVATAWSVAESVLTDITVRQGPTPTYDPATDETTIVWADETTGKKALLYLPKTEEVDAADHNAFVEGRMKFMLVRVADFPDPILNDSEVEIDSVIWQVKSNQPDPSNTINVLTLLR